MADSSHVGEALRRSCDLDAPEGPYEVSAVRESDELGAEQAQLTRRLSELGDEEAELQRRLATLEGAAAVPPDSSTHRRGAAPMRPERLTRPCEPVWTTSPGA